jgi:hypothetical protein
VIITQPLPIPAAVANEPAESEPDLIRLLMQWGALARNAAEALAHGLPDWASLTASQIRTEEALASRYPWEWRVIQDALIAWEATLLHGPDSGPHPACSHCRRERAGLPAGLPLPRGGAR